ncbi:MAG: hypothetical protein AB2A00_32930, partial [Myxococcota bacterium]
MVSEVIYNALALVVDGAAWVALRGAPRRERAFTLFAAVACLWVLLAGAVGNPGFHFLRLLSWGVFVHAPLWLGAAAV